MGKKKKVLIHQIQDSLTNLEDSLEYFRPDYVFLLASEHYSRDKPDMALMEIEKKNVRALGSHVEEIEYSELVTIRDAWHKTTMMDVYELFGEIKKKCEEKEGRDGCVYYAGLADGTALMTVGIAFAAVLHEMKTYFTRGRRTYYNEEYVLEIENLNKITATNNWLEQHYTRSKNLRYLSEIIRLEDEGMEKIYSVTIAEHLPFTQRAVDYALRVLENRDLIKIDRERDRLISSTDLGRLTIRMNSDNLEEE